MSVGVVVMLRPALLPQACKIHRVVFALIVARNVSDWCFVCT
jgi:hypothetical protein